MAGEQQVSGALTPDLPLPFLMDRHCCSKSHPPSSMVAARARLLHCCKAAPCSTATGLLDPGHAHLPWLTAKQDPGNREWLTVRGLISFTHLDPSRRIYFGCSKHTWSTLQRHFGFVWNNGKEATVNTQLLIVHYKKKEQCDQRGHSQLGRGYSACSLGLVLDSCQRI